MSILRGIMKGYKKDGTDKQKKGVTAEGESAIDVVLMSPRDSVVLELLSSGEFTLYRDDIAVYKGRLRI
jgi:hypothetical protein